MGNLLCFENWYNEKPAYNGRFCEMAAVTPQKRQCKLGSYYPAQTFVKPPPRKAAGRCLQGWRMRAKVLIFKQLLYEQESFF